MMISTTFLKQRLLAHYHDVERENLFPIQIAKEFGVPVELVKQANWELLQERKIELKDITR